MARKRQRSTPLRRRLGRRIRHLRRTLTGLSQENFSLFIGVERAHYGRVENGRVNVTLDTLEAIAGGLGVAVRELFEFD